MGNKKRRGGGMCGLWMEGCEMGWRYGLAGCLGWMDVGGDAAWPRIKVPSIDRSNGHLERETEGSFEGKAGGDGFGDANLGELCR